MKISLTQRVVLRFGSKRELCQGDLKCWRSSKAYMFLLLSANEQTKLFLLLSSNEQTKHVPFTSTVVKRATPIAFSCSDGSFACFCWTTRLTNKPLGIESGASRIQDTRRPQRHDVTRQRLRHHTSRNTSHRRI